MTELNSSISNTNINRESHEKIFFVGRSVSNDDPDSDTGTDTNFGNAMSTGDISSYELKQSMHSIKKFTGKFRKISGNEGHTMKIELKHQGEIKKLFIKLSNEDKGHFAYLNDKNTNKIHIHHSFGFATFTIDESKNHLMEENHTDGENWMWEKEGASLCHVSPSENQSIPELLSLINTSPNMLSYS